MCEKAKAEVNYLSVANTVWRTEWRAHASWTLMLLYYTTRICHSGYDHLYVISHFSPTQPVSSSA